MKLFVVNLILMFVLLTAVQPSFAQSQNETACQQVIFYSVYQSDRGPLVQQAVAQSIVWTPTNKKYLITVAHAVTQASEIWGICQDKWIALKPVLINETEDFALLAAPETELTPLFSLPQKNLSPLAPKSFGIIAGVHSIDYRYENPTLLHPFFKTLKAPQQPFSYFTANPLLIDHSSSFTWSPRINNELGTYTLKSFAFMVPQVIYSTAQEPDSNPKPPAFENLTPFLNINPRIMTVGVRPGMSGMSVFEWRGKELNPSTAHLIGLVSKTKSFSNETLLVPARKIEELIKGYHSKQSPSSNLWSVNYHFDKGSARLFPYLQSPKLKKSFKNVCDSEFRNTSEIKLSKAEEAQTKTSADQNTQETTRPHTLKSPTPYLKESPIIPGLNIDIRSLQLDNLKLDRGGDWADGGGNNVDSKDYLFGPSFMDSRYVPSASCQNSGIIDSDGHHWIGLKIEDHYYPVKNIDDFIMLIKTKGVPDLNGLVDLQQREQLFGVLCKNNINTKHHFSAIDAIFPQSETQIEKERMDNRGTPPGLAFSREFSDDSFGAIAECSTDNRQLKFQLQWAEKKDLRSARVEIYADSKEAELRLNVGRCRVQVRNEHSLYHYQFSSEKAKVRMTLGLDNTWQIRIYDISPSCGLSMGEKYRGALNFEIKIDEKASHAK